jgi:NAD(P)-dependent dehydrogenase (short-subunit alcohol dehydrogenase family)
MTFPSLSAREDFAGRTAVVTGAASGIGRATAEILLSRGATVFAVDISVTDRLEELADQGARALACDVTSAADRRSLVEETRGSDLLVNSAGIIRLPALADAGEEDWDLLFDVNAKAVFFLCQQLGGQLQPGGAIVNLASIAARNAGNTETGIYAATKAAVLSLTRTFAHAYAAREVRVNTVVPGLIDTPMQDYVVESISIGRNTAEAEIGAQRTAGVPMRRLGSAHECAEAIVWLLSPASAYVTGQALSVDGGATML